MNTCTNHSTSDVPPNV